jgi:hypothetical protein
MLIFSCTRQIVDDGFEHLLAVYQDERCHVLRLHAAVWSGELKRCPVWTAFGVFSPTVHPRLGFSTSILPSLLYSRLRHSENTNGKTIVSHESEDQEWIYRRSKHRIWLKKVHPFVFCDNYRKKHQIQRHGEFEIYFIEKKGKYSPTTSTLPILAAFCPNYHFIMRARLML